MKHYRKRRSRTWAIDDECGSPCTRKLAREDRGGHELLSQRRAPWQSRGVSREKRVSIAVAGLSNYVVDVLQLRERTCKLVALINSPKPSRILSQTFFVASGVTSRFAGPVTDCDSTRQHACISAAAVCDKSDQIHCPGLFHTREHERGTNCPFVGTHRGGERCKRAHRCPPS